MVEQVEGLRAEGELDALVELEILDERQVEVDAPGTEQRIPAKTAVRVDGGCPERGGIEPALERPLIGGERGVAQPVRTAARPIRRRCLQAGSERQAGLHGDESVRAP